MSLKAILAAFAAAILFFLLGWLVYGILLMDFMTANTTQYEGLNKGEDMNLFLLFLANLSMGFILAIIFGTWARITTFSKGFIAGLILFFLLALNMDLSFYAMMNLFTLQWMVVDIIVFTIMGGLIGGVVGWILGYGRKAATA